MTLLDTNTPHLKIFNHTREKRNFDRFPLPNEETPLPTPSTPQAEPQPKHSFPNSLAAFIQTIASVANMSTTREILQLLFFLLICYTYQLLNQRFIILHTYTYKYIFFFEKKSFFAETGDMVKTYFL